MRRLLIGLVFLWGCSETDLLTQDVRRLDEYEKAKVITRLWQRCEQGVNDAQAVTGASVAGAAQAPDERVRVGEKRIRVLEEALPYGRRAFELAPLTSIACTYWFALCSSYLGWEYDIVGQIEIQQGKDRGDAALARRGEERREKARVALTEGVKALLHYVRVYYEHSPNVMIYEWLEINYEMLGRLQEAYLAARDLVRRLESLKRGGANPADVDAWLEKYKGVMQKLEQNMRDAMIPVPK
ncbi:MAG TPA: hypothetical protein DCM87_09735 [Planctomycetes bacterium]|jgi:hypothetical protein|nr:hypothetical protein [Planctomycetota bacterium]